jgi:hypothetical protein
LTDTAEYDNIMLMAVLDSTPEKTSNTGNALPYVLNLDSGEWFQLDPNELMPNGVYLPALKTLSDPIQSGPIGNFWAPDVKIPSPHQHLIPEATPVPCDIVLDRDKIIRDGSLPKILPAALGLQSWIAERRIMRYQKTAESQVGRRAKVAAYVGDKIINQQGYQSTSDEFRPQTLAERIMAWRMQEKFVKANIKNASANALAEPFRTIDGDSIGIDYTAGSDYLSKPEKRRVKSAQKLNKSLIKQSKAQMRGRKVPLTGKRVNGFEQFITTKPAEKAAKAIKKRDKTVRKAEALRQKQSAKNSAKAKSKRTKK